MYYIQCSVSIIRFNYTNYKRDTLFTHIIYKPHWTNKIGLKIIFRSDFI